MTKTKHTWIKKIEPILREELNLESTGSIPSFDFALFSSSLSKALSLEGLSVNLGLIEWKPIEHVTLGFGISPAIYAFECPLIKGPLYWIVAERDLTRITEWLEPNKFLPKELVRGLYEYLLLEGLDALQTVPSFKDFSCQISSEPLPEQGAIYSIDISLEYNKEVLWFRLALSLDALTSVKKYFATTAVTLQSLQEFPHLLISLYLSAGFVQLTEKEFDSLNPGDLIVLDKSFFRPKSQKGIFQLTLNDTQIFQVKIKDNHMKILDFTYNLEEDAIMDNEFSLNENDTNDDIIDEELEDELIDEESGLEDEENPEVFVNGEDPAIKKIKLKDVPLTLHVEIKRLKMTLEELHKLSPGQTIPLSSGGPINFVHLTLNGQAVAEGELLEISENVIGVRISKIYR
jgi:flagellar motor switch protein FliN/FliY